MLLNEVGEHEQTICEQEKVKKEPKSVLSMKKVKRKTVPDNVPAPFSFKG